MPSPIDGRQLESIILRNPAQQGPPLTNHRLSGSRSGPAQDLDMLVGLHMRHHGISIARVQHDLESLGPELAEQGQGGVVALIVIADGEVAVLPAEGGLGVQLGLHHGLVEVVLHAGVLGAGREVAGPEPLQHQLRILSVGLQVYCCCCRVRLLEADACGCVRIQVPNALGRQLRAPDAGGVGRIRVVIPAVGQQCVDFGPEVVVPGVEAVPDHLPPPPVSNQHPVANHHSSEVDLPARHHQLLLVGVYECAGQVGDEHAGVGLPRDPEPQPGHLREAGVPGLQGRYIVLGCSALVVHEGGVVVDGVASAGRGLEEQQVGLVVPAVGVGAGREVPTAREQHIGADLLGEALQTRAAGAAIQPEHQVVLEWPAHGGQEHVEYADSGLGLDIKVAAEHFELAGEVHVARQLLHSVLLGLGRPAVSACQVHYQDGQQSQSRVDPYHRCGIIIS